MKQANSIQLSDTLSSSNTIAKRDMTLNHGQPFLLGLFTGPTVEETLPALTSSTPATFLPPPPVPTTARSPVML